MGGILGKKKGSAEDVSVDAAEAIGVDKAEVNNKTKKAQQYAKDVEKSTAEAKVAAAKAKEALIAAEKAARPWIARVLPCFKKSLTAACDRCVPKDVKAKLAKARRQVEEAQQKVVKQKNQLSKKQVL
mmetsp:Transcript_42418/g.92975  ORF Transcript_42418/g.92975 Transcript_42418/m.92975 type:complete len:128 (+) Transcript_42418:210-593(+)